MSTRTEYINWRVNDVLTKIGEEALAKGKGEDWHTALNSVMEEILVGQLRTLVGVEWDHEELKKSHEDHAKQLANLKKVINELIIPVNWILYDRYDLFPDMWYWHDRGASPTPHEGGYIQSIP